MPSTAIVLNPHARRLSRDPRLIDRVRRLVGNQHGLWVTQTFEDLQTAARQIRCAGAQTVVLGGGDGTFMAGASALYRELGPERLPRLVFAPAGTVATIARNFGQKRGLVETIRIACHRPESLVTVKRPSLDVCEDSATSRIGFIFGAGLVSRFFDEYYAAGANGYSGAARIVARLFAGSLVANDFARSVLEPVPCRLTVDGRPLEPSAFSLVIASVVRDVGLHTLVTYRAGEDPDRPHLVASSLPTRKLGPQWLRVVRGKSILGEGNFDGLIRSLEVEFADGAASYVLDGDLLKAQHITLRAGPQLSIGIAR